MSFPNAPEKPLYLASMANSPRRRTGLAVGIAVAAVVLVGATVAVTLALTRNTPAGTPAAQQGPASTTGTAAPATTTAATAAASAPPTAAAPAAALKLGAKADGASVTAVAYSYKQPVAANATKPDQEGFEWGAADVEICSKVDSYLNHDSWRLTYADHTMIEPSSVGYRQFPEPDYPWGDTDVVAGQCVRGWITYAVPAGKRPATILYQPQSFRAEWTVA